MPCLGGKYYIYVLLYVYIFVQPATCLNVTEFQVDFSSLNIASSNNTNFNALVDKIDSGSTFTSDVEALMSFEYVDDISLLTAFHRLIKFSKHNDFRTFGAISAKLRPNLVLGIVRAGIQAKQEAAARIVLGVTDTLVNHSNFVEVELVVKEALSVTKEYPSVISRTLATAYPTIVPHIVGGIQGLATETKTLTVTSAGATVSIASNDAILTIPAVENSEDYEVSLLTYDCKYVTTEKIEAGILCYSVLPHIFQEPVTLSITVPDDGQPRKCMKTENEIGNNWRVVPCQDAGGKMIYFSKTFSVLTAVLKNDLKRAAEKPTEFTISEISRDTVPIPAVELPHTRFSIGYNYKATGSYEEYLTPVTVSEEVYGQASGQRTAMGSLVINEEKGRLYWSDGSRIQTVVIKDALNKVPILQAPTTLINGQVIVRLRGENLGIDIHDIIGVRVSRTKNCKVNKYISDKEIECSVEDEYDSFSKTATHDIKLDNIEVSTHRRAKNKGIPIVRFFEIDPCGRKPNALFLHNQNTLFWADENSNRIYVSKISEDGRKAVGLPKLIIEDVSVTDLLFHTSTSTLFYSSAEGYITKVKLDSNYQVDKTVPKENIASNLGHPCKLQIDMSRQQLYVAIRLGKILRIDLTPPYKQRLVIQRPSRTRLESLVLKVNPGPLRKSYLFWAETDSNKIMRATFSASDTQIVSSEAIWTKGLLLYNDDIYWSEYLGQICKTNAFPEMANQIEKSLIYSNLGTNVLLSAELSRARRITASTKL